MTTRQERHKPTFASEFFQLNELDFEQLLVWAKMFATELPFRDHNDQEAGHWGNMFNQNELIICATIQSLDLELIKREFRRARLAEKRLSLQYIVNLFRQLNQWYIYLQSANQVAYNLKLTLLHEYQTHLVNPFKALVVDTSSELKSELRFELSEFDSIWGLEQNTSQNTQSPSTSSNSDTVDYEQLCFSKIVFVITRLKSECKKIIIESLKHGEHPPQFALYVSFLRLFKRAQKKINQFISKHIDFYYRDILNQKTKQPSKNGVYLKLTQNPASPVSANIERNTVFSPGTDENFERIDYVTTHPTSVTDAEVDQVLALTLGRDPLDSPEKEMGFVSNATGLKLNIEPNTAGHKLPKGQIFSIFGNNPEPTQSNIQSMGMIISDPIFTLPEGQRDLTVQFKLKEVQHELVHQQLMLLSRADEQEELHTKIITQIFTLLLIESANGLGEFQYQISAEKLLEQVEDEWVSQLLYKPQEQQFRDVYCQFFLNLLLTISQQRNNEHLQTSPPLSRIEFQNAFFYIVGQLISRHALSKSDWLTTQNISTICECAKMLTDSNELNENSLETIENLLLHSKTATFYQLFKGVFDIKVTTPNGWEPVIQPQITPLSSHSSVSLGFTLKINLNPGFPPVIQPQPEIHGEQYPILHPAIQLTLTPQSNCFPYSIFRNFEFASTNIDCQVKGIAGFKLFNNDGQTDSSQPFHPFGVQPSDESYLVITSEELAKKQLEDISFQLEWADLPRDTHGFKQYYADYPYTCENHSFQVAIQVLSGGQWQQLEPSAHPLFQPAIGKLEKHSKLHISGIKNTFIPVQEEWPDIPFSNQSRIRNGLFKLLITSPHQAFGHREYGQLFSQILTQNAKSKHPQPLPNEPYTPLLNSLLVDYKAQSSIKLDNQDTPEQGKIIHIHPFGYTQIFPINKSSAQKTPRLLPHYQEDGHLFIGIHASGLSGYLNLFFLFDGNSQLLTPFPSYNYQWQYLVDNEWIELPPENIIQDTTLGFLTTGLITLDIPAKINTAHQVLPDGLYWLKVTTNHGIGRYPNCLHIATHVLKVYSTKAHELSFYTDEWQCHPKNAALDQIQQLTPIKKMAPGESRQDWVTRVSETLRHKQKAITPRDYELLLLEKFSSLKEVHCFPSRQFDTLKPVPGRVLIIVISEDSSYENESCHSHPVNSAALLSMRDYLISVSRQNHKIEVRNPGYEKIQVRCQVSFSEGVHHGFALRQLNNAISQTLCPWQEGAINQGIGWKLSLSKLAAFISKQPNVTSISELSVLKISDLQQDDYSLQDSAVPNHRIETEYPWYMLVPVDQHHIQTTSDLHHIPPKPVGISDLVIGKQFIVGSNEGTE